jgi:pimeloyl-ACP methyl ester carboxylesterase
MTRSRGSDRTPTVVTALGAAAAVGGALALGWLIRRRTSAAAQQWRHGSGRDVMAGPLGARVLGQGHPVILLIPGLASTVEFWGAAYDRLADDATLVIVDPLGFGRSMRHGDEDTVLTAEDHVAALTAAAQSLGLAGRPTTVVGHSMGASLALLWAAATPSVTSVVSFDAPLYRTQEEADERVRHLGWLESLMSKGPIAEATCEWMCRHREVGATLSTVINPELPTPVARAAILHTWPAYIGSFTSVVTAHGWVDALQELAARGVPVTLVNGSSDPVPVPGRAQELASMHESVRAVEHAGDHHLPLTAAAWCAQLIVEASERKAGGERGDA